MDGYEIARLVKDDQTCAALPGRSDRYGQESDRRRAAEAGFDLHLTKPVDPDKLRALVDGDGSNPVRLAAKRVWHRAATRV